MNSHFQHLWLFIAKPRVGAKSPYEVYDVNFNRAVTGEYCIIGMTSVEWLFEATAKSLSSARTFGRSLLERGLDCKRLRIQEKRAQ